MQNELDKLGFKILENSYSTIELGKILQVIKSKNLEKKFGIREFLITNSDLISLIITPKVRKLINSISPNAMLIKSIYFDKPPNANWIVNWHQDLTINVKKKVDFSGFKNWRVMKDRVVVQPPLNLLKEIYTIRIHLDHCTKKNGALNIVPKSHLEGVITIKENIESYKLKSIPCEVGKGGILIMKPLLLHSSKRTENNLNRRVIHLEFCNFNLPNGMFWKEAIRLN